MALVISSGGAIGPTGPAGATGADGPTGATGPTGPSDQYPPSPTDPVSPPPTTGVRYYNTAINEQMVYDGTRAKWLSVATITILSGASGPTLPASFFFGMGDLAYGSNIGHAVPKGTVTSVGFSQSGAMTSDLEVLVDNTVVTNLAVTAAGITLDTAQNADFGQGLMKFRNKSTGATVSDVQIVTVINRRV